MITHEEVKLLVEKNPNDMKLVKLFKLRGVPTTVILNKNQEEIARVIGTLDLTDEKIINWLKSRM